MILQDESLALVDVASSPTSSKTANEPDELGCCELCWIRWGACRSLMLTSEGAYTQLPSLGSLTSEGAYTVGASLGGGSMSGEGAG